MRNSLISLMLLVGAAAMEVVAADNPIVLGNKRVTLITPTLYRLEYAENGEFVDEPTMFAWQRDSLLAADQFTVAPIPGTKDVEITTSALRLVVSDDDAPFGQINTTVYFTRWGKEAKATGRNLHSKKRNLNLGGSIATLDNVHGDIPLDDGLLSEDGWFFISDTGTDLMVDGWFQPRKRTSVQDQYCFVYGDDFHAPFRDLGVISGKSPMTRKALHGVWYSRWFPYDDNYVNELVAGYREHGFPLDILSMDMDWHTQEQAQVGTGHNFTRGWTGFTWNRDLIPDPEGLIKRLRQDSIRVCVNEHPHDGIRPHEECYADFMRAMGEDPAEGKSLLFDAGDRKYMENFLKYSRQYNNDIGVDFYWVDWQQDYLYPRVRGSQMNHLKWLNRLNYEETTQHGKRGAGYSRWGGWGDHRYPINFSGDATANWDVLALEVKLSQTSGNGGCYYWAHDIGGFHGGTDPELLVRWTQFGSLSAALRVHAARGAQLDRRPWLWGDQATDAMRTAYGFRSQMLPYIYSCVRQVHDSMLPMNRCMFVDYPTDSMAYNRYGQFMLGDLILAAPITKKGSGDNFTATTEVWFPGEGELWWDYFTDQRHAGGTVRAVSKDIFTYPVFVRGGYVLPMQPWSAHPASADLSTLVMRVYPSRGDASTSFSLYEDDGESQEYEQGRYATTALRYDRKGDRVTVTVEPTQGSYTGQLDKRGYELELCGFDGGIANVKVDGRNAKVTRDGDRYYVKIPKRSIRKATTVTFTALPEPVPEQLKVGTTLSVFGGINGLTYENLAKAKAEGVDHIEVSLTNLVNGDNPIPLPELKERFRQIKARADSAGVNIWSIHMPYDTNLDPSKADEDIRAAAEESYRHFIDVVSVLEPEIILFHPSWRLGTHRRDVYINQLVKTITNLNPDVKAIGATIVIENILGRKHLRKNEVTRPLCYTVEEMVKVMSLMPADVLAAIDTNHIKYPERLIDAMAGRIGSVHIADGTGYAENHQLPGRSENDWDAILESLHRAGYRGPFMYEIKAQEVSEFHDLKDCYDGLYTNWIQNR
ncbi:MAG: TIM barrel protein [Bacteroidales bacterium]|nr:TIM barrel protein [Bacteroidales bacterium]